MSLILVQPTSEAKFIDAPITKIIMPCASTTVINRGTRVKLASNLIVPTAVCTDNFCGVADFANPPVPLGTGITQGSVLLKDNDVYFDAPVVETFNFGDAVYAYDDLTSHYSGAVTASSAGGAVKVGTYVGASGVSGGPGVKIAVKLLPTQII
jgi:hypothetical protein